VGIGPVVNVNTTSTTTYYVRAEGDCNVTACESTTVTVNTSSTDPTTATSNAPVNGICLGGSVTLTVSGSTLGTGAKYYWYEDGCGNGAPIDSSSTTSITITPAIEGLHSYYVRAEGPCNTTNCAAVQVLVGTPSVEASGITSSVAGIAGSLMFRFFGRHEKSKWSKVALTPAGPLTALGGNPFTNLPRRFPFAAERSARANSWLSEGQRDDRLPMDGSVKDSGETPSGQRATARRTHQLMFKKWSQARHE